MSHRSSVRSALGIATSWPSSSHAIPFQARSSNLRLSLLRLDYRRVPRPGPCDHPVWITPRGHRREQDVDVPNPRPQNRLIERHANRIAAVAGVPAMAGMIDQDTPDDLGAESKEIGLSCGTESRGRESAYRSGFVWPRLRFEARSRGLARQMPAGDPADVWVKRLPSSTALPETRADSSAVKPIIAAGIR